MTLDDINAITLQYLRDHPVDPDAYLRYVMSDDWEIRLPFIYTEKQETD